jgi:hypothetical protein
MTHDEILCKVVGHTLIGIESGKLQSLLNLSDEINSNDTEGCIIEVGVYTGGSAKLLALANQKRMVYLFDTFQGIPYTSGPLDKHQKGDFSATETVVRSYLSDCQNVRFCTGIFPQTWPKQEIGKIALAHCDVDMQRSAEDFIKFVYPNLAVGGFMVFDDYNAPGCEGVKYAVDEFMNRINTKAHFLITTQCVVKKEK